MPNLKHKVLPGLTPVRLLAPLLPFIGGALLLLGSDAEAAIISNVTIQKPVTSSGFVNPYEPAKAVDGSLAPTSRWYTADAGEKWIQVDLQDIYSLHLWKLTGMGLYYDWYDGRDPYAFRLMTSIDGVTWKTADAVQGNRNPLVQRSLTSVEARYVKLVIDQGNDRNDFWASVIEFESYGELLSLPAAPANFTSAYQNGAVQLKWEAVSQASSYELRRNGQIIYSGPLTSYEDNGALPAGEVIYSIKAINAKGSGDAAETKLTIPTEAERAANAAAALEIGFTPGDSASSVTQNIILPATGLGGSIVSWNSDAPATIDLDGKVTRPSYVQGDRTVTLTATVKLGAAEATRTFSINVLRETTETALNKAEQELTLGDLTAVTSHLVLPVKGYGGTDITWSSSEPGIIAVDGTVHRPSYSEGDADVTLTAALRLDGLERTKAFAAHVSSLPISDEEAVSFVHQTLEIPVTTVTTDLSLPASGPNGVHISWRSSHPEFLDSGGRVTLPSFMQGDQTVILEATLSKGQYTLTKTFTLLIPALPISTEEEVKLAADTLVLDYPEGVKDSITLPINGAFDTNIDWSSDRPEVLDEQGRVNRPRYTDGDASVQLTATVSKDTVTVQKTFRLTVLKALPNTPYIRLNGTNPVLLEAGNAFKDPGASVVDSVYGTVLAEGIMGIGTVDVNISGVYKLSYSFGAEGWTAEPAEREVHVRPRPVSAAAGSNGEKSLFVTGALPLARLELYNSERELVSEAAASPEGEFVFRSLEEDKGYYVIQVVNGMSSSPSELVYVKSLTASDVAGSITSIPAPKKGETMLKLPQVPPGFSVAISTSSHPTVVRTDGVIREPISDTRVTILFEVTKDADGSKALSRPISITVPGSNAGNGNGGGGVGNSSSTGSIQNSALTLQQSILFENGLAVVVYKPTAAYLDQQISVAKASGMKYAPIKLTGEKDVSRVMIDSKLLPKFTNVGFSIQSGFATLNLSKEELQKLSPQGRSVEISLQSADGEQAKRFDAWTGKVGLKLAGPSVKIGNNTGEAAHAVLPLRDGFPAGSGSVPRFVYVLATYTDGTEEVIPAEIIYGEDGNAIGAGFEMTDSGSYVPAVLSGNAPTLPVTWTDAQGHWAAGALQTLASRGWIQGYGDGTVRPDRPASRAEIVSILVKAFGLETAQGNKNTFIDMDGHWAASAVEAAYAQGWIKGMSSSTFDPETGLTREQAIVILVNALAIGKDGNDLAGPSLSKFRDGDQASVWAIHALEQAVTSGWTIGYPDGTLRASEAITRGELAGLIVRALGLNP